MPKPESDRFSIHTAEEYAEFHLAGAIAFLLVRGQTRAQIRETVETAIAAATDPRGTLQQLIRAVERQQRRT